MITAAASLAACGGGSGDSDSPVSNPRTTAPQLLSPADHGGGIGWENDDCMLCHPANDLEVAHEFSGTLAKSFT